MDDAIKRAVAKFKAELFETPNQLQFTAEELKWLDSLPHKQRKKAVIELKQKHLKGK